MHTIHRLICHEIVVDGDHYLRLDSDGEESWYKTDVLFSSEGELSKLDAENSAEMEDWFQERND